MTFLDTGFYFVFLLILNKPVGDIINTECYLIAYGNLHKEEEKLFLQGHPFASNAGTYPYAQSPLKPLLDVIPKVIADLKTHYHLLYSLYMIIVKSGQADKIKKYILIGFVL